MVKPKPASTLVIMKDREFQPVFDILMLLRSPNSSFVPSAYVFPGGGMDDCDRAPEMLDRCRGLAVYQGPVMPDLAENQLPELAFWVTAIRETFEEAGILYVCDEEGRDLDITSTGEREKYNKYQREINNGTMQFNDMIIKEGLYLSTHRLAYISHWVTPSFSSIRYDTQFFAATAPPGSDVKLDGNEIIDYLWITPEDALQQNRAGNLNILLPTMATIESFHGFTSAGEAIKSF